MCCSTPWSKPQKSLHEGPRQIGGCPDGRLLLSLHDSVLRTANFLRKVIMTKLYCAAFSLLALALLAACAEPGPPIQIRSGIGQAVNLDALRPPSGATYRYAVENDAFPLPLEMRLTSKRRSATRYDYAGAVTIALPEAANLKELSQLISKTLEVRNRKVEVRGNTIIIPVNMRTDNRFRSTASNFLLQPVSYAPHDCFAVIGTCRYAVRAQDGRSVALISETTEKNGIWRSRTRPDARGGGANRIESAIYSIDQNGVPIDIALVSVVDGRKSVVIIRRR